MPRFVILRHDPPTDGSQPLHWDLMLETGDVLRTWALPEEPSETISFVAKALPDHRRMYLDYEGSVSRNRGSVQNWDRGNYQELFSTQDELLVLLEGSRIRGQVRLVRSETDPEYWRVEFGKKLET